jgi:hypothetical protein
MTEHLLHPRIIESKDWATILFVLAFVVAITKSVYENRFGDFMNLIFSDKYAKCRDGSHLKGSFTISVFCTGNFLCLLHSTLLSFFGYGSKTDLILYIQIITF